MGSVKYFISIDLCSEYWQCHIAYEDIPKAAFFPRYGIHKWVVMPMGLMNAPTTFMKTINNLFSGMLDYSMALFLDDILVYSHIVKEHFKLLQVILRLCTILP